MAAKLEFHYLSRTWTCWVECSACWVGVAEIWRTGQCSRWCLCTSSRRWVRRPYSWAHAGYWGHRPDIVSSTRAARIGSLHDFACRARSSCSGQLDSWVELFSNLSPIFFNQIKLNTFRKNVAWCECTERAVFHMTNMYVPHAHVIVFSTPSPIQIRVAVGSI